MTKIKQIIFNESGLILGHILPKTLLFADVLTLFVCVTVSAFIYAHVCAEFSICDKTAYAQSAEVTQSFTAGESLSPGALVSLDSTNNETVVLANKDNGNRFVGVYANLSDSVVALNATNISAQVATSGKVVTLVSDLYGDIKNGDFIAVSSISGIGAKSVNGNRVIGIAQSDFSGKSNDTLTRKIKDASGKDIEVNIGAIPMVVSVGSVSNMGALNNQNLYGFRGWLESIAGRQLSNLRVALVVLVSIVMIVVMSIMIYSGVRSSLVAIGRNPLAKPVIFDALTQLTVMILIIALLGTILIYMILKG